MEKRYERNLRRSNGGITLGKVATGLAIAVGLGAVGLNAKASYDDTQKTLDTIRHPISYVNEDVSKGETYWHNVNAVIHKYGFPNEFFVRDEIEHMLRNANKNKMLRPDGMIKVMTYYLPATESSD